MDGTKLTRNHERQKRISNDYKHGYGTLLLNIGKVLNDARRHVARAINNVQIQAYWQIGCYIIEYEQHGRERAAYGEEILERLSKDLTLKYGKGFSRSNLIYMRKLYVAFPKRETLSHILSWSHYFEILKAEDPLETSFYVKQCEKENWSVRELKRQMKSMLFHRIALGKDKEQILKLANDGMEVQRPEDILRDPYVLEFAGLPEPSRYKESDLESALTKNLENFLLELGKGFAFIGRQYRISIGGRHFYIDLVFYHRILKVGSINFRRLFYINGSCIVLSSFCFYSVQIACLISRVARYTPSSTVNLPSTKTQKSDKGNL